MFETNRLTIRPMTIDDRVFLHALDNDPEVMQHINGGIETSQQFIDDKIVPLFTRYDERRPHLGYLAIAMEDAPFIGWCCLRAESTTPPVGSIGYRLMRKYWGQGIATEAAQGLLRVGFDSEGFAMIRAGTYEFNNGSRNVLTKCGFVELRRFRADLGGQTTAFFADLEPFPGWDIEYGITAAQWRRRLNTYLVKK